MRFAFVIPIMVAGCTVEAGDAPTSLTGEWDVYATGDLGTLSITGETYRFVAAGDWVSDPNLGGGALPFSRTPNGTISCMDGQPNRLTCTVNDTTSIQLVNERGCEWLVSETPETAWFALSRCDD